MLVFQRACVVTFTKCTAYVCACVRACERASMCACERVCVRAYVRARVCDVWSMDIFVPGNALLHFCPH